MGLTKQDVREVLDVYIKAWETQDPDLIVTIFTPEATYHERVMEDPIPDREAIRRYWESKVVEAQANITCQLLNLYLDGDTATAEWLAEFDDVTQGVRKQMKEIAVLEFEGHLISSLREYWSSKTIAVICPCCHRKSHHPEDIRQRYCGACHWWTGDPVFGPPHLEGPCEARG